MQQNSAFVYVAKFYPCMLGYKSENYVVVLLNVWIKIPFLLCFTDVLEEA